MAENFKRRRFQLEEGPKKDSQLNPEQLRAVSSPTDKPLLIVAGAGTGKTKTLTSRIIYLMSQGVPGENICAITFTNKAAKEMAERVIKGIELMANSEGRVAGDGKGEGYKLYAISHAPHAIDHRPYVSTFHSLGAKILRKYHPHTGRTVDFAIFDENDSFRALKRAVKRLDLAHKEGPAWFAEKISRIKNGQINPAELAGSSRGVERAVGLVFEEYEEELARNNGFDFDDLIYQVNKLFSTYPETRKYFRERFTHILVDEYQDINNSQYEMLRHLVGPGARLSVVGDDQQTIYSWRGSNFEIFLNFERDWPEAESVVLEQNYRSAGNILRAAGAVIKNNLKQKQKTLRPVLAEGEKIVLLETLDEEQEAAWVAWEIANGVWHRANSEEQVVGGETESHKPSAISHLPSVAILYRTNAQSRAVEQALLHAKIPYLVFGGIKFYERKEIKDLLAAARFLANPQDSISKERLEKN
ncbi:MAG: UvrD-helicase domain-containing protein, partial [Candidatus Liptonbacteria bacterium]